MRTSHGMLVILACLVLFGTQLAALSGSAPHSLYQGFAKPEAAYSIGSGSMAFQNDMDSRTMSLSTSDFAVYRYGYYSLDGKAWERFELSGNALGGDWLNGSAAAQIAMQASDFGLSQERMSARRNFVVVYSCTRADSAWDCHKGWQIWQFNASLKEASNASIISVSASSDDSPYVARNTLDGDLSWVSRWSAEGDGQWIEYELSEEASVGEMSISANSDTEERTVYFSIEVSTDGESWQEVYDGSMHFGEPEFQAVTFPGTVARYVRLVGHGSSISGPDGWNSYTEVQIEDFPVNLTECVPESPSVTCGTWVCGDRTNNCGVTVDCGDCPSGSCVGGECVGGGDEWQPPEGADVLFHNDFEQRPLGKYATLSEFVEDWHSVSGWGNRGEDFEIVSDPAGGSNKVGMFTFPFYDSDDFKWLCWSGEGCSDSEGRRVLFDHYPDVTGSIEMLNGVGPSSGGGQWYVDLGGSYDDVYVYYRVRFSPDFNAVDGGKLFGFYPRDNICPACDYTDCLDADGNRCSDPPCDGIADDFTSKIMFHDGYLGFYIYHYDKTEVCGDSSGISNSGIAMDGQWHSILFRTRLNTVDNYDSLVEVWIDGQRVGSLSGMRFKVGADTFGIETLGVTTFFGGDSGQLCERTISWDYMCSKGSIDEWIQPRYDACAQDPQDPCSDVLRYKNGDPYYYYAPRKTEHLYVDDITVYTF